MNQPTTGINCQKYQCLRSPVALCISQVFKKGTQAFHEGIPAFLNIAAKPGAGNRTSNMEIRTRTERSEKLILRVLKFGQKYHKYGQTNYVLTVYLQKTIFR